MVDPYDLYQILCGFVYSLSSALDHKPKQDAMTLKLEFVKTPARNADTAVICLTDSRKLSPAAETVDDLLGGIVQHHIKAAAPYKANVGQTMTICLPPKAPYTRVILLGLGDVDKLTPQSAETAGARLLGALKAHGSTQAVVLNAGDIEAKKFTDVSLEGSLAFGMRLGTYEFEHYKTTPKKKDGKADPELKLVSFLSADVTKLKKEFTELEHLAQSIFMTRNLVNEPPNRLYPESFAKVIVKTLKPLGVSVEVLDSDKLKKMGMGCITAVGQASENPPCMVTMSWPGKSGKGKTKKVKPLGLVGKGITFDTGGLTLKPYDGMLTMKCDMAGAAAVVGAMHMLAQRNCPIPVVATVALAENSVSDEAVRPSDIVTSYSGKTVEILNTDAEGRLVLCDALTYIQKKHDPHTVIDLATLTGAMMVALGLDYCGTYTNNDKTWEQIATASAATGEKVWRMPIDENFRRELDSPFADIKNVAATRFGGSSHGAAFLMEFIDKDRNWAHLDIAGVATQSGTKPTAPKVFATGWGVRLLDQLIRNHE